jgi:ribosomal protein S21
MKNVQVEGSKSESNSNILRRFSRKARNHGIVQEKKDRRYYSRPKSDAKKKQEKLDRLKRLEKIDEMIKLGQAPDRRRQ